MLTGHGGNVYELARKIGCTPLAITDMSSNVNPIGPPPGLLEYLAENLNSATLLPEVDGGAIIDAFSKNYGVAPENILVANGTTQFIYTIPLGISSRKVLIMGPTYADYKDACIMHNVEYEYLITDESKEFVLDMEQISRKVNGFDTVFICNPNNPTGTMIQADKLRSLVRSHPDVIFVIDESYLPFVINGENESMASSMEKNVIVLNSMSKIFKIPGLRIGFLISSKQVIQRLRRYALPWSVNSLAALSVNYVMEHSLLIDDFIKKTQIFLKREKSLFCELLEKKTEIKLFPGKASFILARLPGGLTSDMVCRYLAEKRILIRNCANFIGLSDKFIRVSLKTEESNKLLARLLINYFVE